MKTKLSVLALALFGIIAFTACDDDDNKYFPDETVTKAFDQKYPNVDKVVEWETKAGYEVAEFYLDGNEAEAWFDKSGRWLMTKTEISYGLLPEPIRVDIGNGEYKDWKKTDIDKVERAVGDAITTIYVVELENGNQDVNLYYAPDGTIIKTVPGGSGLPDNFLPVETPTAIVDFINQKYPGAVIIEVDFDITDYEVDIVHDNIYKDVYFKPNNDWLYTEWELRASELPINIMDVIQSTGYGEYQIDEITYIEQPNNSGYRIELEKGEKEVEMFITSDGIVEYTKQLN